MEVKGRDFQTGLPKVIEISEADMAEAIQKPLKLILEGIKDVLALTPPELAADIVDKGIVLSGGTSLLTNLDRYVSYHINVASFVVEEPLLKLVVNVDVTGAVVLVGLFKNKT